MRHRLKFKAHMARKDSARMTMIPQLEVPEIFIENEEDRASRQATGDNDRPGLSRESTSGATNAASPGSVLSPTRSTNPFLSAAEAQQHAQHRSWTGVPADLSSLGSHYGPDDGDQGHRTHASAFSFDLHEPEAGGGGSSNRSSRRGSSVRPEQVTEMLNSSVWMDSIRRSATMKRGPGGSEGAWGGGGYNQW